MIFPQETHLLEETGKVFKKCLKWGLPAVDTCIPWEEEPRSGPGVREFVTSQVLEGRGVEA